MAKSKLVSVDLTKVQAQILSAVPHSPDTMRIVRGLGAAAMHQWKKQAQQNLKSTARDYLAGLKHTISGNKAILTLECQLPNMVEQGWDGGDMREWMLAGGRVKQGPNGPYRVIPFRHGTPGTGGRNVGRKMPKEIYDVAKTLKHTLRRPGKNVKSGSLGTEVQGKRLHPGLPMSEQARDILKRKEKPHHATSIYMGMIRKGKEIAGGKTQTTGYQTFRTISKHSSDAEHHWIHPGIKPRHLAQKVNKYIGEVAQSIVMAALEGKE